MSETGAWILLFLTAGILVLILCILFWQPNEAVPQEEKEPEYQPSAYDLQKTLILCWPELTAAFSRTVLEYGILLHWTGLSEKKRTILISVTEGNMMNACMNAASDLYRENRIPENDFWILISAVGRKKECIDEASCVLRNLSVSTDAVFEEGTGIVRNQYAFLTVSLRSVTSLRAEGGRPRKLAAETAFPFVRSDPAADSLKALGRHLPLMLRIQFFLRFFTGRKPYRNLIRMIPEAALWVRSSLDYDGGDEQGRIILRSPDDSEKEQALADVLRKAELYGTDLYREEERPCTVCGMVSSEAYRIAAGVIREIYGNVLPVPVVSDQGSAWPGRQTVCFSPPEKSETGSTQREYYKKLIG